MKKVFRFFAMAAFVFGMTAMVACGDKEEGDNDGNGGNGGNEPVENPDNLPTSLMETFDNGIPATWTNIDADGDGYKWQNYLLTQDGAQSVQQAALSASYMNTIGALTPDNYLVTPLLWIEDGAKLTYEVSGVDATFYAENYTVYVGVMENGAFVSKGTLLNETVPSVDATTRTIDLSEYKGQALNICFRHHDNEDIYYIVLDNVKVGKDAKGLSSKGIVNAAPKMK